jgi:trans-aconitate 2-methyltransferase
MPTWDPSQYLQFADERTLPCRDLVRRIDLAAPAKIIDLGCGPGNSTAIIAQRWPSAAIAGLDNSAEMIAAARKSKPKNHWIVSDIMTWANSNGEDQKFDLVFSNAAIQWVEDHATAFAALMRHVAPGGALAAQMPGNYDAPAHTLMRELAASPAWRGRFPSGVREWNVHDLPFYYDVLSPHADRVDLWATEYMHIMPESAAIVEWYRGTGLRPFLDALKSDSDRDHFTNEYGQRLRNAYPQQANGRVLFPFRRVFMIAYRK